jgi:hypothetical protein
MKKLGVITGDLVGSSELAPPEREKLYKALRLLMKELKDEKYLVSFEMYRGDSLQCVVNRKQQSLRVALLIRSYVKSYTIGEQQQKYHSYTAKGINPSKENFPGKQDIRLSIGIGSVDFFSKTDLAHSDGEAFRFSGEGLDSLKRESYRLAIKTPDDSLNESLEPAIMLLDAVIQKWTNNQAEALTYKLKDWKEDNISKKIGVSQPAINQRIKSSQWFAIEKLLQYFEKIAL